MSHVMDIIQNKTTTYQQKVVELARLAENSYDGIKLTEREQQGFYEGLYCDLSEGTAPYRPRYVLPDYGKLLAEGCSFLRLAPAKDLDEAIHHLLIFYKHVPSVTTMPVYLGNLDTLLEPFVEDNPEDYKKIKLFLTHIDRTITDSFSHANIGPRATVAGRLILKAIKELKNTVPNLTLKYDEHTPDEFALLAIETGLEASNPSFANHGMYSEDFGDQYGIASCYNALPIGGGGYTLVRMNLRRVAEKAGSLSEFMNIVLPETASLMGAVMSKRIRFMVEESTFFESNFLATEGFVSKDRFVGMYGVYGLAEAVDLLLKSEKIEGRYGHSEAAAELAQTILEQLQKLVDRIEAPYSPLTGNRYLLHAQSGISSDIQETPGARIPYGDEPEMLDHLIFTSRVHKYFPTGVSDIFTFDQTSKKNLKSVLDVIKGAMKNTLRMFAFYSADSDLVRITGFLVKKSDIEQLRNETASLHDTTQLGLEAIDNQRILDRKVQKSHD